MKIFFQLLFLLFIFSACNNRQGEQNLKTGDLLFVEESDGHLSDAIDKVTQTGKSTHYSHVGLVEVVGDSVFVLHASSKGGTCRISLHQFLYPSGDSIGVVAYRLKSAWQNTIPKAIICAKQMLGQPYNFSYILSDSAHYCSEFVYRAFLQDSVFKLHPMTFKEASTGEFSPTWIEYYQKLGIEIPEGEPGCNPNGLAASDKLEKLGVIK